MNTTVTRHHNTMLLPMVPFTKKKTLCCYHLRSCSLCVATTWEVVHYAAAAIMLWYWMCSWLCAWSAADFCWMVESREHLWLLFISVWVRSSGDVDEYECNIMQPDGKNRCFQQWINALEHWNGFHTSAGTLIEHEPRAHPEPERLCSFGSSGRNKRVAVGTEWLRSPSSIWSRTTPISYLNPGWSPTPIPSFLSVYLHISKYEFLNELKIN